MGSCPNSGKQFISARCLSWLTNDLQQRWMVFQMLHLDWETLDADGWQIGHRHAGAYGCTQTVHSPEKSVSLKE